MNSNSVAKPLKKKRTTYNKGWTGTLFALPYLIFFTVFTVLPVFVSIFLSFTEFNMLELPKFIGMENYLRLFLEDSIFIKAVGNTLMFAIVLGPGGYLLSMMFAWFINEIQNSKLRALVTLAFYAPSVCGNNLIFWNLIFSSDSNGVLNGLLYTLGITSSPILFLQTPQYIFPIVIFVGLWGSFGTGFLSFIAGFKGVDRSYYEAAAMDGISNRWQELWFVTLPIMRPQMLFSAVMSITGSFTVGGIITALCGYPTTNYAAQTIMNHLDDYGGIRYEIGYASAISVILFIMMVGSNLIIQRLISKVGE